MLELIGFLAILFVVMSILTHNECGGLAVLFGVVGVIVTITTNKDNIVPFLTANWVYLLSGIAAYFVIGALYSVYAFHCFVKEDIKRYKEDYYSRSYNKEASLEVFKKDYNIHLWCDNVSQRVSGWISLWPFHLFGDTLVFIFKDLALGISRAIYDKMVGVYRDVANRIIDRFTV